MKSLLLALALAVPALGMAGFAAVYGLSELRLRDVEPSRIFVTPIRRDPVTIERGRHIARTRGCFGCHGQQLQGADFSGEWDGVARAVAPNLAAHAREHDAATLEAAIRQGIGADGRAMWSMPSYNFTRLTDEDVAALIAYLQSAPIVAAKLPSPRLGWKARWQIVLRREEHIVSWVAWVPPLRVDPSVEPILARGEYLAMTTCNECHGLDLRGTAFAEFTTPDLAVVAAYPEEAFRRLMKEGVAMDGRSDLGLMTEVAKDRFSHFTDEELTDLYAFLKTLGNTPSPQNVVWRQWNP